MATQTLARSADAMALDAIGAAEQVQRRRRVHPTVAYVARRLGLYLLTMWGAFTAAFIFFRLIPGDPISILVSELARQGQYSQSGNAAMVEHYEKVFGLNGSL